MIYVGVDPSFTKTGVCYFDTENKHIVLNAIQAPGTNKTYKDAINRSGYIALNIIKPIDPQKDTHVLIEEPLMSTFKASRLGILSGVVVWTMAFMPFIKKVYSITPTYISRTNKDLAKRENLNKKQASQFVANAMLEIFKRYGYTVEVLNNKYNKDGSVKARKISHDESEALILVFTMLLKRKALESDLLAELLVVNEGLVKIKAQHTLLKGEVK